MLSEKKEYFENGNLKAKWHEDENGIKKGTNEEYWENGLIKEHSHYKANKKDGMFLRYTPKGKYIKQGIYSNGIEHGDFKLYTDRGTLRGTYKNGRLHGELILTNGIFDYDNEIEKKWCENGKQYSLIVEKNENGSKEYYKDENNNYIGTYKEYYLDRITKVKGQYVNGKEDGFWYNCYKNGKIKSLTVYQNGNILSCNEYYDNDRLQVETKYFPYHKKEYFPTGELFSETFDKIINEKEFRISKGYLDDEVISFSVEKTKELEFYLFGLKDGKLEKVIEGTEQKQFKGEEALKKYQFVSKFLGEDFLNLDKLNNQEKISNKESKQVRGRATRGHGGNER